MSNTFNNPGKFSGLQEDGTYLVSVGMTANDNGFCPTSDKARNVGANDWLAKDCTLQDISNRSIRRPPHLLQLEF